jgi:HEAT repeat protein
VEPLIAALKDKNENVRREAAGALGRMGDVAVGPLIAVLEDEDANVRGAAARALGQTGDARAVEPLIGVLKDDTHSVRNAAAEALDLLGWKPDRGRTGAWYWIAKGDYRKCVAIGAVAVDPLIAALKDKNENVRREAAGALGQIGDPRAVEPLIAALKDEDRDVRESAAGRLVLMYRRGKLGEQVKRVILAHAGEMRNLSRGKAGHDDHTDKRSGGCFGDRDHDDYGHSDQGFHEDFSL